MTMGREHKAWSRNRRVALGGPLVRQPLFGSRVPSSPETVSSAGPLQASRSEGSTLSNTCYNANIVGKKSSRRRRPRTAEDGAAGDLLRRAREKAGLTQTELADRLGHTQQAVAQAERAESNPTVSFLRRWARACGRSLSI